MVEAALSRPGGGGLHSIRPETGVDLALGKTKSRDPIVLIDSELSKLILHQEYARQRRGTLLEITGLIVDDENDPTDLIIELIGLELRLTYDVNVVWTSCSTRDARHRLAAEGSQYRLLLIKEMISVTRLLKLDLVKHASKIDGLVIFASSVGDTINFPDLPEQVRKTGADVFRYRASLYGSGRGGAESIARDIHRALIPNLQEDAKVATKPVASGDAPEPLFLFVGHSDSDSVTSRLKTTGVAYKKKMLDSLPENWERILSMLDEPSLVGVLVKLTNRNCDRMYQERYRQLSIRLCQSLGHLRHIVLVHESFLDASAATVGETAPSVDSADDELYDIFGGSIIEDYFSPPSGEAKDFVWSLIDRNSLNLVPYSTNAELSVLAATFINQNESNLLFRIYIPSSRLWANEADKLLGLFRDWLTRVKGRRIRQGGYRTDRGGIYEFYGDDTDNPDGMPGDFEEFSAFLDMCLTGSADAARLIDSTKVDAPSIYEIVDRYAKEARRIRLDLKQARESRILSIRHQLESELSDTSLNWSEIDVLVNSLVPQAPAIASALTPMRQILPVSAPASSVSLNVNQQIIGLVQGTVSQSLQGTVNYTAEAEQILDLIERFGGRQAPGLVSALHELEDDDARAEDRLSARQKLKAFLFRLAGQAQNIGVDLLERYLERRLGLPPG